MPTTQPVIAVLDNEPEMRKALRRLLSCCGFRVEGYENGEEFLDALGLHPPDCLLLDLHMPELNGFDLLEDFRFRQAPVPVVVITAHDEPGTSERVRALGASACLRKPVDRDVLLSAIAEAIDSTKKQ
jgi:FixJ family two-component response regulator